MTLADGRALPASVLAAEAGVAASRISEHLARLLDAKLLTAERQGRARYFRLVDPSVAEALEAIARISPPEPIRSLRQGTRAHAFRRARTCYNHVAGPLETALTTRLLDLDRVRRTQQRRAVLLTDAGRRGLHGTLGVPDRCEDEGATDRSGREPTVQNR